MNLSHLSTPQRVSLGAIGVTAIAAFLPWVSVFGIGATGVQAGDGWITLFLAVVGGIVLMLTSPAFKPDRQPGKAPQITLIVLAGLVTLVGIADMNGAAAIGLYLTLFAGLAWVGGAVWTLVAEKPAGPISSSESPGNP